MRDSRERSLGYREVLKLCQEALDILSGGPWTQAPASAQSTDSSESDPDRTEPDEAPRLQPVSEFLSETDTMISEVSRLIRRYEAMKDTEDMTLDALADGVNSFTGAAQEKLNKG